MNFIRVSDINVKKSNEEGITKYTFLLLSFNDALFL